MSAETVDQIAASTIAAVNASPVLQVEPIVAKSAEPAIVEVRAAPPGASTKVTMMKTLEPPPTVGDWVGFHELRVARMSLGSTYLVPHYVAEVLLDSQAAVITG